MSWTKIHGWLSPGEGQILRSLAVGARVLELGSFEGRSTVCMAEVASHVTAVDWHQGDDGCGHRNTFGLFLGNLVLYQIQDKVTSIVARIGSLAGSFPVDSFDLAFIDDDHDADAPLVSTKLALSCVKPGGTIAWHDWNRPNVQRCVRTLGLTPLGVHESLAWLTR